MIALYHGPAGIQWSVPEIRNGFAGLQKSTIRFRAVMPVYQRQELEKLLQGIDQGHVPPIYLLFGDRYLCQEALASLIVRLLPDPKQRRQNLHLIDGDQEDPIATLNQLRTYSLFPGRQLYRVMDSKLFNSKVVAAPLWEKAAAAWSGKDAAAAGRYLLRLLQLVDFPIHSEAELSELPAANWQTLFGFAKPKELAWLQELLPTLALPPPPAPPDATDLYQKAIEAGLPPGNILILVCETMDKRKRFYKFLQKNMAILDLTVDTGSSKFARTDQEEVLKELLRRTLAKFGKKMEPRALTLLLDRVGFHPVALVNETEKLALSVADNPTITLADLDAMVSRTREEALYELTDAFSDRDLAKCLLLTTRLLENGVIPLVIVSGFRNHIRKLLLVRSFQASAPPNYVANMNAATFQKGYLPELQVVKAAWVDLLPKHPYALYLLFAKAEKHALPALKRALAELLAAEARLKSSSGLSAQLVIENFLYQSLS